jgi:hypothetical protein
MQDKPTFTGGNKSFGAALNRTIESLWRHGLNPAGMPGWSESADGWVPPLGNRFGSMGKYGFEVSLSGENGATVAPSIVSGMGSTAIIPVIGSDPLDDSPPPVLTGADVETWVALYMEVIPTVSQIYISDDAETEIWAIAEGGGSIVDEKIEVRVYADVEAMDAASQIAAIDPATGDVIDNAKFVIPLAKRYETGSFRQIGFHGPLGVRMCASGAMVALAPAHGPFSE